jgi:hypothetical protein
MDIVVEASSPRSVRSIGCLSSPRAATALAMAAAAWASRASAVASRSPL